MLLKLLPIMLLVNIVAAETLDRKTKKLQMSVPIDSSYQELQIPQVRRKFLNHETTTKTKKQTNLHEESSYEQLDDRWLLMLEAGRGDNEEMKKITPKSVFIAPVLSNRPSCRDGYRYDHLGKCVKVIRFEGSHIEFLLKRLNAMYQPPKIESEEESIKPSNGPLQFSLPIFENLNENVTKENISVTIVDLSTTTELPTTTDITTTDTTEVTEVSSGDGGDNFKTDTLEAQFIVVKNITHFLKPNTGANVTIQNVSFPDSESFEFDNQTDFGNETYLSDGESDYVEIQNTTMVNDFETTTPSVDTTTETSTVDNDYVFLSDNESVSDYDWDGNVTDVDNMTLFDSVSETVNISTSNDSSAGETLDKTSLRLKESNPIKFPDSEEIVSNTRNKNTLVRFPESSLEDLEHLQPFPSMEESGESDPMTKREYWWLPNNWKVESDNKNTNIMNFWSKLPLVRDISFVDLTEHNQNKYVNYEYNNYSPQESYNLHKYRVNAQLNKPFPQPQYGRFRPSQPHRERFVPSQETSTNPWIKYTNHERQETFSKPPSNVTPFYNFFRQTMNS